MTEFPVPRSYFETDPVTCARALLGSVLTGYEASGIIVETEAYSTRNDPACHTAFLNQSRKFVEENEAGAIYVHLTYGIHRLFNILTKAADGEHGFVLIRSLEPTEGISLMRKRRRRETVRHLCSGPGKLTEALGIGSRDHGLTIGTRETPVAIGCSQDRLHRPEILVGTRIGITKAADLPWRFGLESPFLSRKF